MKQSNKEIVRRFLEEFFNQKDMSAYARYISRDYVSHVMPYIGMGLMLDSSVPGKVVVTEVNPNGPAAGKFMVGDEIVYAEDESDRWETYEQLRETMWGLGHIGSHVKVRVLRGGELVELDITRGLVKAFDTNYEDNFEWSKRTLLEEVPDSKVDILHLVEEGDLVACLYSITGTNALFNRQALWSESAFFRVVDGKIVEDWGVSDWLSMNRQWGFTFNLPVQHAAAAP